MNCKWIKVGTQMNQSNLYCDTNHYMHLPVTYYTPPSLFLKNSPTTEGKKVQK